MSSERPASCDSASAGILHSRLARSFVLWVILILTASPALAQYQQPTPGVEEVGAKPTPTTPEPRGEALRVADVALLVGALAAGTWIALKKRSRKWLVVLTLASVAYFGFYRGGCICPIGAVQNVVYSLVSPAYTISILITLIFLLPVALALFAGRIFCGGVCWLGGIQDLLLRIPLHVPRRLDRSLRLLKWAYLAAAIYFVVGGVQLLGLNLAVRKDFIICRYDPFVSLFRLLDFRALLAGRGAAAFHFAGPLWMWFVTGGFLLLSVFVGRPYCRWLCPYGAILGVCAKAARRGVTVQPEDCCECGLCKDACAFGAIEKHKAVGSTCVACARCYLSCPHERQRVGLPVPEFAENAPVQPVELPAAPLPRPERAPASAIVMQPVADDSVDLGYLDEVIATAGSQRGSALKILQAIQEHHRYLPWPALERTARQSGLTMSQLVGLSTFYNQFRLAPVGEHLVRICHGTACHVAGAQRVTDSIRLHLGITPGADTDAQRQFTIQPVACLGCCSLAPVMQIDGVTFGHLTAETACKALDSVREGKVHAQTDEAQQHKHPQEKCACGSDGPGRGGRS